MSTTCPPVQAARLSADEIDQLKRDGQPPAIVDSELARQQANLDRYQASRNQLYGVPCQA